MAKNHDTAAIIDGVLKFTVVSGAIGAGLFMPNLMVALDKPLDKYLSHLDKKARERELRRIVEYMKRRKLISESYEHGIVATKAGKKRLKEAEIDKLQISPPTQWDRLWRIVFYDIPEEHKLARRTLQSKLNELGFCQLQRSVLIHPFPCRDTIEKIVVHYGVQKYVSYIEAVNIDNQQTLINRFQSKYPTIKF